MRARLATDQTLSLSPRLQLHREGGCWRQLYCVLWREPRQLGQPTSPHLRGLELRASRGKSCLAWCNTERGPWHAVNKRLPLMDENTRLSDRHHNPIFKLYAVPRSDKATSPSPGMSLRHHLPSHWPEIRQAPNGKGGPNVLQGWPPREKRQAQQTHDTAEEGALPSRDRGQGEFAGRYS